MVKQGLFVCRSSCRSLLRRRDQVFAFPSPLCLHTHHPQRSLELCSACSSAALTSALAGRSSLSCGRGTEFSSILCCLKTALSQAQKAVPVQARRKCPHGFLKV